MSDGVGCNCYARCSSECACENVDWTPKEVFELKAERTLLRGQLKDACDWLKSAGESIKDHCSEYHAMCEPMCGQGYIDKAKELEQALNQESLVDGGKGE